MGKMKNYIFVPAGHTGDTPLSPRTFEVGRRISIRGSGAARADSGEGEDLEGFNVQRKSAEQSSWNLVCPTTTGHPIWRAPV